MSWSSAKEKRVHFLYRLFYPKGIFLRFVFYFNVQCIEYTFRIYILLHIKKHYFIYFCCLFLTLFRMEQKNPPTSFSPVTSTNVGISPKNVLTFIFNPFATLVQNLKVTQCQPQIIELELRLPSKKVVFLVKSL